MGQSPRLSFKLKISRVIIVSLAFALAVIFTAVYFIGKNVQRQWLERDLSVVADILGNRSVAALDFFDRDAASRNLSSASYHPAIDLVCLYTPAGELFAYYTRAQSGITGECESPEIVSHLGEADAVEVSSLSGEDQDFDAYIVERESTDQLLVLSSIESLGVPAGELAIVANRHMLDQGQRQLMLVLLVLFFVVLASALAISSRMLGKALKPLNKLHDAAKNITVDNLLEGRVEKYSEDEVGELVEVFNTMLDNLAKESSALVLSERRFRALAESAPIGIFLKDENYETVYVNDRWCSITGQPEICRWSDYVKCISDIDLRAYEKMVENLRDGERAQTIEYRYRAPGRLNDHILMEYLAPLELAGDEGSDNRISGYVGSVMDVTELKNAQSELEKLAYYDPLTHLPNRRYFKDYLHEQLGRAKENKSVLSVVLVDLDNFKRINDTLGHDAGDILLSVLAGRIKQRLHAQDLVARMGGDEFYVVLRNLPTTAAIEKITRRIQAVLANPIRIKNHFVEITASIGVANFPDHADTPEELMRNADIALYKAKADGRNRVAYFSQQLDEALRERMHLESRLREAVNREILEIYIQPQFDVRAKRFKWAEVLLRWNDPDMGFIPPDKFIAVAEETGMINDIDQWVLRASCRLLAENRAGLNAIGIEGLSINLSARQFYSRSLLSYVENVLAEFQVPAECISFEVTESMVIDDVAAAISTMEHLRKLGCRISIDDFGTGYSSLSYLKRLPLDSLKIDRSFISDIPGDANDVAITSAIIAMAEKLNIAVVAEGIETEEQCNFLMEQGCFHMQGYYFARPGPIEVFLPGSKADRDKKLGS